MTELELKQQKAIWLQPVTWKGSTVAGWSAFILLPPLAVLALKEAGVINLYYYQVLMVMGINAILSVSLNLVNGFSGQFSLGHAGFMAVGAYTAALLTSKVAALPFFVATLCGGGLAALIAYIIGLPAFKTRGDYLAVITLAFNMIIVNLLQNTDYVGGPRGLPGIRHYTEFPWVWAWVVLTVVVQANLMRSAHGRAILAVRENEQAAELGGIDVHAYKLLAFSLSGFFAGVAGSLSAHLLQFIAPQSFNVFKSFDVLVMLYLGGVGSISGAFTGAVLWTGLLEALRGVGVWRLVIGPLLLVVLMIARPKGILGDRELPLLARTAREEVERHAAS
ncbi:MAG TPA: branched-chain amino acid ABC transporter permease [Firmicutes bacterium]|nr:branched-chain amino acid ABC transporter permease [Bacillota bacterium]